MSKIKIVLDADVVIHFNKGSSIALLLDIFPEYEYILLDVVYDELSKNRKLAGQLDHYMHHIGERIKKVEFCPQGTSRQEYAKLRSRLGKGESACMVYCLDHADVLGSSNLRDIKEYCLRHRITYLTTIDFLYYAYVRHKVSSRECCDFIQNVIAKGSRLPQIDIATYRCEVQF